MYCRNTINLIIMTFWHDKSIGTLFEEGCTNNKIKY